MGSDNPTDDEPTPTTPSDSPGAEREAIRELLSTLRTGSSGPHVLLWYGSAASVWVCNREKAPATEYPTDGEPLALIEWSDSDWALSMGHGDGTSVTLDEEVVDTFDSREAVVEAAAKQLANTEVDR